MDIPLRMRNGRHSESFPGGGISHSHVIGQRLSYWSAAPRKADLNFLSLEEHTPPAAPPHHGPEHCSRHCFHQQRQQKHPGEGAEGAGQPLRI